jgi:hypothetical protein
VNSTLQKEGTKMKRKLGAVVLAGTFLATAALPLDVLAGRAGSGRMTGTVSRTEVQNSERIRTQDRLRLRDGSCVDPAKKGAGTMQKKGNTYGPGDGTGYDGIGPKDGTGIGAPSKR